MPFTYSAEVGSTFNTNAAIRKLTAWPTLQVFPLAQREQGMAWAVATCFFWSSVLSLTFPSLLATFGATGAFCFYVSIRSYAEEFAKLTLFGFKAGMNVVALVMIWAFVPESKDRFHTRSHRNIC